MTTLLPRSKSWRTGLIALALVAISTQAHAGTGVICGKPTRTGNVTMHVVVKRGIETRVVSVTLAVDSSWTAEYKANLFWAAFAVTKADTVLPSQSIAKVGMVGQNGWTVTGAGIDNDESDEPDGFYSAAPAVDQFALCSLSGTASGYAADGSPGSFRVSISGRTVTLPTFPGMPASILEQQLMGQLNSMGVQTRLATQADFANGLEVLPHDASVVWMQPQDTTGFEQEVRDTGLALQLATLLDTRPVGATDVARRTARGGVELSALPSILTGGSVKLRYALGGLSQRGELAIFDAVGRRLRRLAVGGGTPATASGVFLWDGRDDHGMNVPNGVYFVRLSSGPTVAMTRVVAVR
ncbi:MAG: hypothetical protein HOP12_02525 [Candidatus Eisenbacteria bacterium]|uniref:FlgD Ig-like domain-containing protein n=1 Tax=Eiseniibacteriota bacterium TaxID=2212470 RepID=A0A849SMB6_UNCEI|nr:hypothetical protein [Candidatus Eisenbacteria bacterium]